MKIIVELTLEIPVEVRDDDKKLSSLDFISFLDDWLHDDFCMDSLEPPGEYPCILDSLVKEASWRLPKDYEAVLFDDVWKQK